MNEEDQPTSSVKLALYFFLGVVYVTLMLFIASYRSPAPRECVMIVKALPLYGECNAPR